MTKVCILGPYETLNIFQKKDVSGGSYDRYMQFRGNALLNTISIDRLDSGQLIIEYFEIIEANVENLIKTENLTATGISQFTIIPFHTQLKVRITTTDVASFTLKCTCREDGSALDSLPSAGHSSFYIDGSVESTPGIPKLLSTFAVSPGKTVYLASINISTNIAGQWSADVDGGIIATGRCHAGAPNSRFNFYPMRAVHEAEVFRLIMTGRAPATAIDFHVQGSEI